MATSTAPTRQPDFGMHSDTAMPSGTSMASTTPEKARLRRSAPWNRAPTPVVGSSRFWNQPTPFQKKLFCPIESWNE